MEHVAFAIARDDIERKASRYRELEEKRRALLERIEKADAAKQTVRESIYRKVRSEYQEHLRAVEEELRPLAAEVAEARSSIERELAGIEGRDQALAERIEELAFRHRIGEFDDREYEKARAPLEAEREALAEKQRELESVLSRMGARGCEGSPRASSPPSPRGTGEAKPRPQPEPTHPAAEATVAMPTRFEKVPPPTAPSESLQREPVSHDERGEAEDFVDPSTWLGEFLSNPPREEPSQESASRPGEPTRAGGKKDEAASSASDSPERPSDDPLLGLAEPGNEPAETNETSPARGSETPQAVDDLAPPEPAGSHDPDAGGLRILSIARGAGAGKKVPLLPVTMTLGREMDNNIEIKDKDVARYHARISYASGTYFIEDLEGSTGTFVNGKKVDRAALSVGDVIRVGSTELVLELG